MASREIVYGDKNFEISYEILNPLAKVDLIFLHGWGSNKEIMKSTFSKKMLLFRHIYIDLPGFGRSSNEYSLTTNDFLNIIELFLKEIGAKKDIVAGHSFGGKIATLLKPKLLVLFSSAGIVTKKPFLTKLKIVLYKALKPIGGKNLYRIFATKDVDGLDKCMYETLKNVVDEDFEPLFERYTEKAVIFWGKEDRATPLSCGKKIATLIKNSSFYPIEGDHYFFLKNSDFISKRIIAEYENL
jgi:pimeloyl-ACP methyl ester carboxylesterase